MRILIAIFFPWLAFFYDSSSFGRDTLFGVANDVDWLASCGNLGSFFR